MYLVLFASAAIFHSLTCFLVISFQHSLLIFFLTAVLVVPYQLTVNIVMFA